jgi:hypothetical protein
MNDSANNNGFDLKEKIRKGREVNAMIEEIEKRHEEELERYKKVKALIYGQIKDYMIANNMLSSKTAAGQAVMANKKSYRVENQPEFMRHVVGTEDWEVIVWAVKRSAAEAFEQNNNGAMIPGVAKTEMVELRLLAPEKKRVRKPDVQSKDEEQFDTFGDNADDKEANNG